MKSTIAMALVANAIYASAQSTDDPTTITEYYDDCSTISTITDTSIHTYGGANSEGKVLTTYATVYTDTCSTGLEEKTYTITEPCTNPGEGRSPGHVPYGYALTTVTCNVCGPTPVTATLITPAPAPPASAGGPFPVPAAPTAGGSPPAGGYPGGSSPPAGAPAPEGVPAGAPASSSPSSGGSAGESAGESPASGSPSSGGSAGESAGESPAGGSPAGGSPAGGSPGESSGESPAGGAPAPGGAAPPYPNPNNPNRIEGVPTAGPSSGNTGPITPFLGAASCLSVSVSFLVGIAGAIGALAFAL